MEQRKALIVGLDDYPNGYALHSCKNDAEEIARLLKHNDNGSPNFDVSIRTDIKKEKTMKKAVKDLFRPGSATTGLFYYSGHGDESGNLVTPDVVQSDQEPMKLNEVLALADHSGFKNKIIILDSCFSGQAGTSEILNQDRITLTPGTTIITASSPYECAVEKGKHGVFTDLLIQGLKGYAADTLGNVTAANLYAWIDQSLGAWSQRPMFKTYTNEFFSLRKVKSRVPEEELREICHVFPHMEEVYDLDPSYEYTNTPDVQHEIVQPYAQKEHVERFKLLQRYQKVGLVEPVGEEYMYFAAMHSKGCRLTALGKRYWQLSKDGRF